MAYAWTEDQRKGYVAQFGAGKDDSVGVQRYKGLGEMNATQLWETTMNPDTRRLMRVGLGDVANAETAATMTMLMGRAESQARRAWLEEHGNEIEADV
jgi:topoisomerase-4 subunit B